MQAKKHVRFDWAIKRLLRQKANFGILEGFLSELLKEDIKIVEILDSESNQETSGDKYNRVDILVRDQQGDLIIIEVQNSYALDYFLRILYGISKAITEHMKEGDTYAEVKKLISVNIVYFNLGQGDDYIYHGTTCFEGLHSHRPLELTVAQKNLFKKEKIQNVYPEIYLIKVNNFNDNAKDTLDEWIYFLKNSEIKQEFSAKGIQEADQVLKRANMSDRERGEYQRFVEVLSDRASAAMTIEFETQLKVDEALAEAAKTTEKKIKEEQKKAREKIAEQRRKTEKKIEEERKQAEEKMKEERKQAEEKMKEERKQAEEKMKEERKQVVVNLLNMQYLSDEQIAQVANVSLVQVKTIRKQMNQ